MTTWQNFWRDDVRTWENIYPSDSLVKFMLHATKNKNRKFLDLGCGNGAALIHAAHAGYKAVGVEISTEALHKAHAALALTPPTIRDNITLCRPRRQQGLVFYKYPTSIRSRPLTALGQFDLINVDGVFYYMSEEEITLWIKYFKTTIRKKTGAIRIYTKAPDDDLIRSAIPRGGGYFEITMGYEAGQTQFVPPLAWWKSQLKDYRIEVGYDRFNFTGKKKNSFFVFTARLS